MTERAPRTDLALACAALACLAACAPGERAESRRPRHVVLVLLDGVRADHAGAWGYARPTTPRLDALAAGGLLFEEARAASSSDAQSLAALWTGRLPVRGGSTGLQAAPHPALATLPQLFRRAGFRVAIASNQPVLRARAFTRGCDELEIDSEPGRWSGERVTERALELAGDARGEPLFLVVDYADASEPHRPPAEFRARIDVPAPDVALAQPELRASAGALPADVERSSGFQDLVARYDAEIAYADACLGALVDGLRARGLYDDALLVVTSSRGAEFLEHGYAGSGWTLFDEVLHVPLVIHAPRHVAPGRVAQPVSLVDLLPTLAGLFALDAGAHELDGVSLLELGEAGIAVRPRAGAVIAELVVPELCVVRAAIEGPWKLVETVQGPAPAERAALLAGLDAERARIRSGEVAGTDPFAPAVRAELFDLARDPGERRDLAASSGAELERLRAALERYRERCRTSALAAPEAETLSQIPEDEVPAGELQQLGYL